VKPSVKIETSSFDILPFNRIKKKQTGMTQEEVHIVLPFSDVNPTLASYWLGDPK
jgi:hypothetical protein